MSTIKHTNEQDFNKNQVRNFVVDNQTAAISAPGLGQFYFNTTTARAYYWSGTNGTGNGLGWIEMGGGAFTDNYVDTIAFGTGTGFLTLGRTGTLPDLSVNLDGRYLTGNQTITIQGDIYGTGTTTLNVTATSDIIVNKPETTSLNSQDFFLYYDNVADELSKISWGTIDAYIQESIGGSISPWTLSTSPGLTWADVTLSNGFLNSTVRFLGTSAEVEVQQGSGGPGGGVVQIGLPSDVTITNNLTVGGNLVVNGEQTILNTTELKVEDNIITLNSNVTGTPLANAGIEVNRGSSALVSVLWNESTDRWTFTNDGTTFYNIPISSEYNNFTYTHPTFTAITLPGSGLQFVQSIAVNNQGHVTAASLGTIPSASTTVVGVTRLATDAEALSGATNVALQPSQIGLASGNYKTTITGSTTVTHNLGTTDVRVELFDTSTGETIYTSVTRTGINTVFIEFGLGAPANTRVLITKV